jgi:4-hydroxybenzoate polyprenyltransferase
VGRFLRYRVPELPFWLGIPALGLLAADRPVALGRLLAFALADAALMIHLLLLNDWGGLVRNPAEGQRVGLPAVSAEEAEPLRWAALLALALGLALGAALSERHLALLLAGGAMSLLYSHPRTHWKERLGRSLLLHLAFGLAGFGLGYLTAVDALDRRALLGLFFALLLPAGLLVHQAIDVEEDRRGGVVTAAVRFGPRPLALGGLALFALAHLLLVALAVLHAVRFSDAALFSLPVLAHGRLIARLLRRAPPTPAMLRRYRQAYRVLFLLASALFALRAR